VVRFELLKFLPLVRSATRLAVFGVPGVVGVDELATDAVIGLLHAAREHRSMNRDEFRARASRVIKGAIADTLRELEQASAGARQSARIVYSTIEQLATELHRAPTDVEAATRLGIDETGYFRLADDIERVLPVPMDALLSEDPAGLVLRIADTDDRGDLRAQRKEVRSLLFDAFGKLPQRGSEVVELTYRWGINVSGFSGLLSPSESGVGGQATARIGMPRMTHP
jgi:RNA polymerase sigma factor for flagellar operon FliA